MFVIGIWQYIFLLFHLKEVLKLFTNLLYRSFASCLVFEIYWLKKISCPPSWINFYLIIGDFSDVTSRVSHIKLRLNDQRTISLLFEKFSVNFLFEWIPKYDFGLIIINICVTLLVT